MIDRRQFLLGSMLIGGSGAALVARPAPIPPPIGENELATLVPGRLGPYATDAALEAVLPSRDDLNRRIYDRYLARGFVAPGRPPVMLVIAYGATQDYGLQLHRPEVCYPASGWRVTASHPADAPLPGRAPIPAMTLDAFSGARSETILYWSRIGGVFPTSNWQARAEIVRGSLTRNLPDGVLVRLSTPTDQADPLATLRGFHEILMERLAPAGRALLLGKAR